MGAESKPCLRHHAMQLARACLARGRESFPSLQGTEVKVSVDLG